MSINPLSSLPVPAYKPPQPAKAERFDRWWIMVAVVVVLLVLLIVSETRPLSKPVHVRARWRLAYYLYHHHQFCIGGGIWPDCGIATSFQA